MKHSKQLLPASLICAAWLGILLCSLYTWMLDDTARLLAGQNVVVHDALGAHEPWRSMQWTTGSRLLVLAMLLLQCWSLWQLRRVGSVLLDKPAISRELAAAFRWLGHSLLAFGLFAIAVPTPAIHHVPGQVWAGLERLAFPTLYLLAIGCLCVYATAWLLTESVRLKEENEGFV